MNIPDVSLPVIVNSRICEWKDSIDTEKDAIGQWVNHILNQKEEESLVRKQRCEVCLSKEDQSELELHHIAGKKHDYRTITTCIRCHVKLTNGQKLWDARWWRGNQSENLKIAFFLKGLHDLLTLKADKTGNSAYRALAEMLVENISQLLKTG